MPAFLYRCTNPSRFFVYCSLAIVLTTCGSQRATTHQKIASTPTSQLTATPGITQEQYQQILHDLAPVRLVIPTLHLNAPILSVGTDQHGAMLVYNNAPANDPIWDNVYWSNASALPGQRGNAVIAGHVNQPTPAPAPFTHLTSLRIGDSITVQTVNGTQLTFQVTGTQVIPANAEGDALDSIFGPADNANLNLITCAGYDGRIFRDRLVVFTRLQGPSPFPASPGILIPGA